ncbi:hypothetical protein ABPG72_019949 [Tetrahymena utriculariae]
MLVCSQQIQNIKNELELDASKSTINRELLKFGLKVYKVPTKPVLSMSNTNDRIEFAQKHRRWRQKWQEIVFSDESAFNLSQNDGRLLVRLYSSDQRDENGYRITKPSDSYKSVMVWGAISILGTGPLVRVTKRLTALEYLNLFRQRLRRYYPGLYNNQQIFQDDNAPCHRAGLVNQWFNKYNIKRIVWPAKSPDLNIIENVWGHIKYKIKNRTYQNEDELWNDIENEWIKFPTELIFRLYESLPRRIEAVIQENGFNTNY